MGVPVVEAPSEAEATCAELVKKKIVNAVATEDMDALTFGAPKLLRNVTAAASKNLDIIEIDLERILVELDLTYDQFIDLCILMGCDYTSSIRGIGPSKAYELIRKYHSIEEGLQSLQNTKYVVSNDFLYKEAAEFFKNPQVVDTDTLQISWDPPNEEEIVKFLCDEKNFNRDRVEAGLERMRRARTKSQQQRLDSYFKVAPKTQQELDIIQRKRGKKESGSKSTDKRQKTK
uniref:Flap endonuclease 1 n=1 Tax=Lygus hesperus TaxID=30085 RepID=A0A0A9X3W2_LYGHE